MVNISVLERSHLRIRQAVLNKKRFTKSALEAFLLKQGSLVLGPFQTIETVLKQFCKNGILSYDNGVYIRIN